MGVRNPGPSILLSSGLRSWRASYPQGKKRTLVACELALFPASLEVPDAHGAVLARGGDPAGAECKHPLHVALQRGEAG